MQRPKNQPIAGAEVSDADFAACLATVNEPPIPLEDWINADLAKSGLSRADIEVETRLKPEGYFIIFRDPATGEPMQDLRGNPFRRTKFRSPKADKRGRVMKYKTDWGAGNHCFILPAVHKYLIDNPTAPLYLVEGEKKAAAACKAGLPTIGLTGIDGYLDSFENRQTDRGKNYNLHPDLLRYLEVPRDVFMVYDSDAADPAKAENFDRCAFRLAYELNKRKCRLLRLDLPGTGGAKVGADDFLVAGGTLAQLKELLAAAPVVEVRDLPDVKEGSGKAWIELPHEAIYEPGSGKLLASEITNAEFTARLFERLGSECAFLNYSGDIVSVRETTAKDFRSGQELSTVAFVQVGASGFAIDVEAHAQPFKKKDGIHEMRSPLPENLARLCLASELALSKLPPVRGITEIPLPYLDGGELKLTAAGYDATTGMWSGANPPAITPMELDAATATLRDLLGEFSFFEPELDLARTLAFMLTPMLRLLTGDTRAMVFLASGNRPGIGKDCLLGLAPIVYTGRPPVFWPPAKDEDEARKQLFALCLAGERFFIISNLKGRLDSPAYEAATTSSMIGGRTLGKSEQKSLPNIAVYALSANDLTLSPDMGRRVCEIHFEAYEEDVTQRKFKRDLHAFAHVERARLLSALYTLVMFWDHQGRPMGTDIASFSDWSRVVSGILVACGFQNPFDTRVKESPCLQLSGNTEDRALGDFFRAWWDQHGPLLIDGKQLRERAEKSELFPSFDFETHRGQVRFGMFVARKAGRVFGGLRLFVDKQHNGNFYRLEAMQ